MSSHRPEPFHRALSALTSWLTEGRFAPGSRLAAVDLAGTLALSATPVREAMSRLAGEGLLEERRGQGFFVPQVAPDDIADLYRLSLACLLIAIDPAAPGAGLDADRLSADLEPVARTEALFARAVTAGGSRVLRSAHAHGQRRLGPVRRLERKIFDDLEAEASALAAAAAVGGPGFVEVVRQFHLRRIREADRLWRLLDRQAPAAAPGPQI